MYYHWVFDSTDKKYEVKKPSKGGGVSEKCVAFTGVLMTYNYCTKYN